MSHDLLLLVRLLGLLKEEYYKETLTLTLWQLQETGVRELKWHVQPATVIQSLYWENLTHTHTHTQRTPHHQINSPHLCDPSQLARGPAPNRSPFSIPGWCAQNSPGNAVNYIKLRANLMGLRYFWEKIASCWVCGFPGVNYKLCSLVIG